MELPSNFCFDLLIDALDILLDSEHFQILCKTLWFIYRNCGRFRHNHRIRLLSQTLLQKYVLKLLLHWSPEVRQLFIYIIVFQVDRSGTLSSLNYNQRRKLSHLWQIGPSNNATSSFRSSSPDYLTANESSSHSNLSSESFLSSLAKFFNVESRALWDTRSLLSSTLELPFGTEPNIHSCIKLKYSLEKEDLMEDELILLNFETLFYQIRDQLENKGQYFSPNLVVYAKKAVSELEKIQKLHRKLRKSAARYLSANEILVPNFSFEIRPHSEIFGSSVDDMS